MLKSLTIVNFISSIPYNRDHNSYYSVYSDFSEKFKYSKKQLQGEAIKMEQKNGTCCDMINRETCCCRVESVVSIDERGQMVLPKQIRDKAKIHAGDKLAVICWEKDGEVCCISLVKTKDFAEMVKDLLGPMMKEIASE